MNILRPEPTPARPLLATGPEVLSEMGKTDHPLLGRAALVAGGGRPVLRAPLDFGSTTEACS